jgi:hypothetical protein
MLMDYSLDAAACWWARGREKTDVAWTRLRYSQATKTVLEDATARSCGRDGACSGRAVPPALEPGRVVPFALVAGGR